MTTMTWSMAGRRRCSDDRQVRGTVVHGSVLLALLSGIVALWATLALLAALLAAPARTMTTLEREGPWGVFEVMQQGSTVLVSMVRPAAAQGRPR